MHDKKAQTTERVAWSETRNLHTDNIDNASKVMAYTDINSESLKRSFGGSSTGVKRESGAVYHFSLSEDPKNSPTQEQWSIYVDKNIERLGLEEHQYYMVAHNDEDHAHVHVVVNLIHPETGKINSLHNDYKKMDKLAHEYELKNGIVCEERHKKYQAWEQEKKAFKEKQNRETYANKVTDAFKQSDNSQSFKAALEDEGLSLAKGNRRSFVLVDRQGEIFALNRLINFDNDIQRKEKNQQINEKLQGIDKNSLPLANQLQEERQTLDRDAIEIKQQKALADAAEKAAEKTAKEQEDAEKIQAKKQTEDKARETALALKEQHQAKKQVQQLKREKIANYENYIKGKIKASREKWSIDELTQERDKAKENLAQNNGFIAKLTGKKRTAVDQLEAQEKTLAERLGRFETDIIHYHKNRPQWVIDKALKKQGIEPKKINSEEQAKTEQLKQEALLSKQETKRKEKLEAEQQAKENQGQADRQKQQENQKQKLAEQFNKLTPAQKKVITASPEQIDRNIKAQQGQKISTASFMNGLSEEQKAKIEAYKQSNPEQDNEKQSQKQNPKPELE